MISRVGIRLFQVSHFVMELLPLAVRTLDIYFSPPFQYGD